MNQAGKGDTPRKVIGSTYRENYEAIFREMSNADIVHKSEFADIECEECLEQSRLLGISAEREESLRGKILRLEAALTKIAYGCDDPKQVAVDATELWPYDPDPFDSPDHDNDCDTYAERI